MRAGRLSQSIRERYFAKRHAARQEKLRKLARTEAVEQRRLERQRKAEARSKLQRYVHPGKPAGNVRGSWLSDLAERRQCVLLCGDCTSRWDPAPYGYFFDTHYEAQGQCDTCNTWCPKVNVFMHECYLETGYEIHQPRVR